MQMRAGCAESALIGHAADGVQGLVRAAQFSWEASVRRVREIYEEVGLELPAAPRVVRDAEAIGTASSVKANSE